MRIHRRPQQPTQDAVSWDSTAVDPAVQAVLEQAAVPAQPVELERFSSALAAYTSATAGATRRSRARRTLVARLLAAKALVAALAVGSLGGVALAASAGDLPAPLQDAAHAAVPAVPAAHGKGASHASPQGRAHGKGLGAVPPTSRPTPEAPGTTGPTATPSPSLVGLCHAYLAGVSHSAGKALDNPAFTVLVTAAGGKDAVSAYCGTLVPLPHATATGPGAHPTGRPTSPAHHATGKPSSPAHHATGQPTVSPQPTPHSTGQPTGH